ncbi:MAG: hypothetical protein ACI8P0_006130, partial [Planctomycetaceae bacterium]
MLALLIELSGSVSSAITSADVTLLQEFCNE